MNNLRLEQKTFHLNLARGNFSHKSFELGNKYLLTMYIILMFLSFNIQFVELIQTSMFF